MEKQIIISISREYGSMGHEISEKIADDLGIALYDRKLLDRIIQEKNIDEESAKLMHQFEERPRGFGFTRSVRGYSNSIADSVHEMEAEYIRNLSAKGESFVIVGRCSEVVLKNDPSLVTVFILGNWDAKVKFVMKTHPNLTESEAIDRIVRFDRERKAYHNPYSKYHWGDSRNYDLSINSGALGIDGTAKMIEDFAFRKLGLIQD